MPKPASPRHPASTAPPAPSAPAPDATNFVCVHGHFYQPPRENPWLEVVEVQDSAAPWHDWNDRICAECYAPNGASRITNTNNEIVRIVNNYARMSYNFGPTLLKWMEDNARRTYRMVIDADRASAQRYSGHGSAIAQVYNHIIMPLAGERDARTQIRWGIADFEYRFGRKPEGMWLAETAVSRAVLDLMATEGIRFTILAPHQCARIRPLSTTGTPGGGAPFMERSDMSGKENWIETSNASVDTTHPYLVRLNEGRSIAVFFYDGPASRAIAFEGLLNSGEAFAQRLLAPFQRPSPNNGQPVTDNATPRLSHVATDGESYGHHHKYGEMALSYAMHLIETGAVPNTPPNSQAVLTNYAEFLARFPPQFEAEVVDSTSWSCAHGVERWRSDCGCNGGRAGFNQQWRAPLREALDLLRDSTAPLAEALAKPLLRDLWAARDAYISVILDRDANADRFLARHAARTLTAAERVTVFELMELERHTQLMYTSCGWFFDEVSGIETVQVIAYAGRVLQLAAKLFGPAGAALEDRFLEILARAKSNLPEFGDAAELYRRYVLGLRVGLEQVGAHYAISSVFRSYPEDGDLFCYTVHRDAWDSFASGRSKVALGRARIRSRITEETEEICFAVLHLGDQNLSAAVRRFNSAADAATRGSVGPQLAAEESASPKEKSPGAPFIERSEMSGEEHSNEAVSPSEGRAAAAVEGPPHWSPQGTTSQGAPSALGRQGADGRGGDDLAAFAALSSTVADAVRRANIPEAIRLIDRFFAGIPYSLTSLFADEQHRILGTILDRTLSEMEDSLRTIYEDHSSLLRFLTESGMAAPPALAVAANYALNSSIRSGIEAEDFDPDSLAALFTRAHAEQVTLDTPSLAFAAADRIKRAMVALEMQLDIYNDAVAKSDASLQRDREKAREWIPDPGAVGGHLLVTLIPPAPTESSALSAPIEPAAPAGPPPILDRQSADLWDAQPANGAVAPGLAIPARGVANALRTALAIAIFLRTLPFGVNLWQAQNIWNDLLRRNHFSTWPEDWRPDFKKLGEALYISVDSLVTEPAVPTF